MAVSTNSYFSNSIQGVPQVAGDVNLFRQDSVPQFAIGYKVETQDGRVFRYGHAGAAVVAGALVSTDLSESSTAEGALVFVAPASAAVTTDGTAGYKYIEITEPSITQDQYAGGHLIIITGTGRGYTYRVKGNTVTGLPDGPASGNFRLELYDPIQETINASTGNVLVGSRWANLETATAATDECVAAVAIDDMSAGQYGFFQTKGICGVLQSGTASALGDIVVLSASVNGAVATMGQFNTSNSAAELVTEPIVGVCEGVATAAADGTYIPVNLMLE